MNDRNITVALVFGGVGCEREVSLMGADNVREALRGCGFRVLPVIVTRSGAWLTPTTDAASVSQLDTEEELTPTFPVRLGDERGFIVGKSLVRVDAVMPLLHGEGGEDGAICGLLQSVGIPYIGCDTLTNAFCIDKAFLKLIAEDLGIPTVKGIYTTEYSEINDTRKRVRAELGYPVFVKPTRLGSSVGASVARDDCELVRSIEFARKHSPRILIEKLVEGARELEIAVIRLKGKLLFTNIGEIRYDGGFYDYERKYSSGPDVTVTPSFPWDIEVVSRIKEYARRICEAVGTVGLSRIDFFLDPVGNIYLNEINTMPGMTKTSLFPRLAEQAGVPLSALLCSLVGEAVL